MSDSSRDVERTYATSQVVAKLRRLADALQTGKPFRIQIAGQRIRVPAHAELSVEHERGDDEEEIEFQLKWARPNHRPLTTTMTTTAPWSTCSGVGWTATAAADRADRVLLEPQRL